MRPPDWAARRAAVMVRDGRHCQVTGCLSLTSLDVHHIVPVAARGSHRLDNLVSLCLTHHWMLPEHALVAERSKDVERFTMRRAHHRWSTSLQRKVNVRATFERYVTISLAQCEEVRDHFGLRCRHCTSGGIHFGSLSARIVAVCFRCRQAMSLPALLAEETGLVLASIYRPTQNLGSFPFALSYLRDSSSRSENICYHCLDLGIIGTFRPCRGRYGMFLGCSNYQRNGCRNTLDRQRSKYPDGWRVGD